MDGHKISVKTSRLFAWLFSILLLPSLPVGRGPVNTPSLGRRLESHIEIQNSSTACGDGAEVARAIVDVNVNVAVISTNIALTNVEWSKNRSLPIKLSRPFTILGFYEEQWRWPIVELLNAKSLIFLAPGGSLNFSRVIIRNWRNTAPYFRAPGMDMIAASNITGGPASQLVRSDGENLPAASVASSAPAATRPSVPLLVVWSAILVHKSCVPYSIYKPYIQNLTRPPELPSGDQSSIQLDQGSSCKKTSSSSNSDGNGTRARGASIGGNALPEGLDRCWSARYLNQDVGLYAIRLDAFDVTLPAGYLAWLYNAQTLCEVVMSESCIKEHGTPMGCYTFMLQSPPAGEGPLGETAAQPGRSSRAFPAPLLIGLIGGFTILAIGALLLIAWKWRWRRWWWWWPWRHPSDSASAGRDTKQLEAERAAGGGSLESSSQGSGVGVATVTTATVTVITVTGKDLASGNGADVMLSFTCRNGKGSANRKTTRRAEVLAARRLPCAVSVAGGQAPAAAGEEGESCRGMVPVLMPERLYPAVGGSTCSASLETGGEHVALAGGGGGEIKCSEQQLMGAEALPAAHLGMLAPQLRALHLAAVPTPDALCVTEMATFQRPKLKASYPSATKGPSPHPLSHLHCLAPEVVLEPVTSVTPLRPGVRLAGARMEAEVQLLPVTLGKGSFGKVVKGVYGGEQVAVKLLNTGLLATGGRAEAVDVEAAPPSRTPLPDPNQYGVDGAVVTDGTETTDTALPRKNGALPASDGLRVGNVAEAAVEVAAEAPTAMAALAEVSSGGNEAAHQMFPRVCGISAWKALAQEVEVLARCQHPNVVKLLAACLGAPRVCLVMELMDTSLDRLLHGKGGRYLPLDTVLHIGIQIARALAYLHPTVLHRDLKPGNVLISQPQSEKPIAKLADFGLSRLRHTVLVTRHPEVGTVPYMAPELFDLGNLTITDRVDIYALGVLMWEMLTHRRPWAGYASIQVAFILAVLQERLPLHELPFNRCPPKLRALLLSCWEQDPARRPAAAEVVKTLALIQEALCMQWHA